MATNTLLTNDIILKEGMMHLTNNLVISKLCNRDFEPNYGKPTHNGATIRIARPIRGQVRTGSTMQVQDVTEGRTTLTVATQLGADIQFTSADLTLSVDKFSERILKPQMIRLANEVDLRVYQELCNQTFNWVGTPGQVVNSFTDFVLAPQRLDQGSVPTDSRVGILSPSDYYGLVGSLPFNLFLPNDAKNALERAKLPTLAGVDLYMSQNVIQHTNGNWSSTAMAITGTGLTTTYASAKDTWYMSTQINGMTANTGTVKAGDVFSISGVYAVNIITGQAQSYLQQFTVQSDATADANGIGSVTISPPIITSGPYATCSAAPSAGSTVTFVGTKAVSYDQSLVFHPDAVTLAMPQLIKPQGAAWCDSVEYEGFNLRLIQGYDGNNDQPWWRFDLLMGVKAHQPWLSTRLSGT